MAAKKKSSKKKKASGNTCRPSAKVWKAPKRTSLRLFTLPFRLIYNLTAKFSFFVRWPLRFGLLGAFAVLTAITIWAIIYPARAKLENMDHIAKMPARTLIYASDNKTELGRLHGDNRYKIKYDDVSPHFISALLAQEDHEFRDHGGVNIIGLFKIPYHYFKNDKVLGASTITMQLARNVYPLNDTIGGGVDRKLMEIALAYRIEDTYSKNEILEHYMNRIFFGHSMYGVEAASRAYFQKSAKDLDLSESAMLAGIIRGPNLFSPFKSVEKATRERNRALDRMVAVEFITKEKAEATKRIPLKITPRSERTIHETYVMDIVDEDLKLILEKHNIRMGNLKVYTTIDPRLQNAAEKHIEKELTKIENDRHYRHQTRAQWQSLPDARKGNPKYLQAGMVCIENDTGAIVAVVGGRSAQESRLNRATQHSKRQQLGSIVKPFVYLSAFNQGMGNTVRDTPIGGWPSNHDNKYFTSIHVNKAIAESRNCSAVHAGNFATKEHVSETLRRSGFDDYEVKDGSYYLGSGHSTPKEVASAYTIFANGGKRFRPYIIKEIRDENGKVIYQNTLIQYSAAKAAPSWRVSQALREVTTTGTARALQGHLNFREPCGGKTGTSSHGNDAWFAGYTTSLSCAVWVGHDTPKNILGDAGGSRLALPIWANIMKSARNFGYPMNPNAIPRAIPVR